MIENYLVPAWIPASPKLAVVGQSPGTSEWRRGRPFVGSEGRVLRGWLFDLGLDPDEDVMYTNVGDRYYPDDPAHVPKGKEAVEGCERVKVELSLVPTLRCVVLLGGPAAHLLFSGRMGEMHGRQGVLDGLPVLACYHPGYYWHSKGAKAKAAAENEILSVLRRALSIVNGESGEVKLPEPEYVEEVVVT